MRNFLSKFVDAETIDKIEEAFKNKYPDSSSLPTYISKTRLDEEINKRKELEKAKDALTQEYEEKLKSVPSDYNEQLNALKDELAKQKSDYETKLSEASKSADVIAKIYESGARNVKAVRALLDETKPIDTQLSSLKETDSYLFKKSFIKGTGKGDEYHAGEGDDSGNKQGLSTADMYRAVGISAPKSV